MRLCTYNINGIRAHLDTLQHLLEKYQPDIVCLQETKVTDAEFPLFQVNQMGYHAYFLGRKSYNGVAILSKKSALSVDKNASEKFGIPDDARMISADFRLQDNPDLLRIYNIYFPSGGNFFDREKFARKIAFHQSFNTGIAGVPEKYLFLAGDMNVCPYKIDVGLTEEQIEIWIKNGECSFLPKERLQLHQLFDRGFIDTYRQINPFERKYTWFSYASPNPTIPDADALRLDYILTPRVNTPLIADAFICYDIRKLDNTSDHCPYILDLRDADISGDDCTLVRSLF